MYLIQPSNTHIAAGMTTGVLSVRKRITKTKDLVLEKEDPRGGSLAFFLRGADAQHDQVRFK